MTCSDSEKKVSQGWGADEGEAELKAETAGEGDAAADALSPSADASGWGVPAASGADDWAVPTTEETPAPEGEKPSEGRRGRDREPEEEDNTLTLDEYLKQQKERELAAIPKLEPRKANEGDDSIWKDAVLVNKKDEDESAYFVGGKVHLLLSARTASRLISPVLLSPSLPHPRPALRRRRKFTSRSTLALSAPPVAAVVDAAAIVAIVAVIALVAAAVVEDAVGRTATVLLPPSMSTTSRLSLRSHDQLHRC